MSSAFENVMAGKLKLKGKALEVKAGGVKKKRKNIMQYEYDSSSGEGNGFTENIDDSKDGASNYRNHLTSAERKYIEQFEKINMRRLAKEATKSHRDRIQEFNNHLANLSEHYDIPKVGPG
ncbi:hypothetical protein Leryth_010894 [Lithospermum erythrorhizon]|nr:hypothetical protein Leryth_010894 [Lithospermum erythrorhizon]